MPKIAIIGAGFTGLSSAFLLAKKGFKVYIFEKEANPGGLAVGFNPGRFDWSIERHYHHLFQSDASIKKLASETGLPIKFVQSKTSVLVDNKIFPLDNASDLISFPKLNLIDRIRMGVFLAFLKVNPIWHPLEKMSVIRSLSRFMGKAPYKRIWEPLLLGKFGKYAARVPLSWFWARIKKRSRLLGYPEGGFQRLADKVAVEIKKRGGTFFFNTSVESIKTRGDKLVIAYSNSSKKRHQLAFDKVIVTLPSFSFIKIAPGLPKNYKEKLLKLRGLGAINLMLILKKPFLEDGTYWLNICDKNFPFLSIVEHTSFIDKKYYGNNHIVYIGNYLPHDHPYMQMSASQLLKIYAPYLKKLNPNYALQAKRYLLFKAPFAQPIPTLNYSKIIPSLVTPIKNIYLANIQQVYPWDRGTNYAVELGEKVAKLIMND